MEEGSRHELEAGGTATCREMPWALPFGLGRGRGKGRGVAEVHQADEEAGGRHSLTMIGVNRGPAM